ncbi:hypothetical protein UK23_45960 [Lentzea aerocolonigenes]|uniref:Uncharacterized protein n=1 Tax=Lentzea aerocolonigenes TaxID=68170 RepID=A0A0F0GH43_LENAE|nr:hypothetical protein UK23_45960 [Lentzea aerocolonigenes]
MDHVGRRDHCPIRTVRRSPARFRPDALAKLPEIAGCTSYQDEGEDFDRSRQKPTGSSGLGCCLFKLAE